MGAVRVMALQQGARLGAYEITSLGAGTRPLWSRSGKD